MDARPVFLIYPDPEETKGPRPWLFAIDDSSGSVWKLGGFDDPKKAAETIGVLRSQYRQRGEPRENPPTPPSGSTLKNPKDMADFIQAFPNFEGYLRRVFPKSFHEAEDGVQNPAPSSL